MSDEIAQQFKAQIPPEKTAPQGRSITISATLHPDGQVEFTIPKNKLVAQGLVGMLSAELAKMEVIQTVAATQQAAASWQGLNGLLKRMNGG